jgi:hypothetical protein
MAKDLSKILLSTTEENKIKEKTPDKLPLNPTAMGWSGQEVRRFLAKSLIDSEGSFLAEFKKKMIEIKAQFEDVFGDGDGDIQGQIDSIIQNIEEVEATAQAVTDLQANKLNKIWADITEQTTTNLTDSLVFNRGSNVYKTTIANLLSHVAVVDLFTVVAELPEVGLSNKIYLVPSSEPETQNALDEFIWVNNDWERIGGISVDLSNYYTKGDIDTMIGNIETLLGGI